MFKLFFISIYRYQAKREEFVEESEERERDRRRTRRGRVTHAAINAMCADRKKHHCSLNIES